MLMDTMVHVNWALASPVWWLVDRRDTGCIRPVDGGLAIGVFVDARSKLKIQVLYTAILIIIQLK